MAAAGGGAKGGGGGGGGISAVVTEGEAEASREAAADEVGKMPDK